MIVVQPKRILAAKVGVARPPAGAARRRSAMLAIALLAVVTALVLVRFAAEISSPALPAAGSDSADLIRRYYAAVNTAIQLGETADLTAVVAADLRLPGDAGGPATGRETLVRRLLAINATRPGLRFVPRGIVAGGDAAIVRIAVSGNATGLALPEPSGAAGDEWIDGFRLAEGKVVEVWGLTPLIAAPAAVVEAKVEAPPAAETFFGLGRLVLASTATSFVLSSPGPLVVVVESGQLWARADGTGVLTQAREESTIRPGVAAVLGSGDHLAFAAGVPVGLRAAGSEPVSILVAVLLPMSAFEPTGFTNAGLTARSRLVELFDRARRDASREGGAWPPGIAGERLTGLAVPMPGGRLKLRVERVTMAPQTGIVASGPTEPMLVTVEQGLAVLETAGPNTGEARPGAALLATGDTALLGADRPAAVRALGSDPTTVLLVSWPSVSETG